MPSISLSQSTPAAAQEQWFLIVTFVYLGIPSAVAFRRLHLGARTQSSLALQLCWFVDMLMILL